MGVEIERLPASIARPGGCWRFRRYLASILVSIVAHGLSSAGLLAGTMATTGAAPARLIMVEEAGCRFCAKWDADVGRSYGTSDAGRFAPLVRVGRNAPELFSLKPAAFTPTFILIMGETEVGRITGYPGATHFWEELDELLGRAGYKATRSD